MPVSRESNSPAPLMKWLIGFLAATILSLVGAWAAERTKTDATHSERLTKLERTVDKSLAEINTKLEMLVSGTQHSCPDK